MTTYTVTTLADENDPGASVPSPGGTGLSLREAIPLANADPDADTITFAASLAGGSIRLTHTDGTLQVTEALTIDGDLNGDGRPDITISGDKNGDDVHVPGSAIVTDIAASTAQSKLGDNLRILSATADLTVNGLTLTGGVATGAGSLRVGGAILVSTDNTVAVTNSIVTGNTADVGGGGIYGAGVVSVTASTVSDNSSASGGGAGIVANTANLVNTTVSGNSSGFNGGGLYVFDAANLTNSTVADNTATGSGGGIYSAGSISLTNSTVTGNAGSSIGGILAKTDGITLNNSIVAGDANGEVSAGAAVTKAGGNIVGTDVFQGSSDLGDTTLADVFAVVGNAPNSGVLSGLLADNGGLVPTVALRDSADNPAIDAANDSAAGVPATDARGTARFDFSGAAHNGSNISDLGAFEVTHSIVVTTLNDVVDPNDGHVSLREAIAVANANPGADTITFDPSLAHATITLASDLPLLDSDVTIDGGDNGITVSGAGEHRIFFANTGTIAIENLTLADGFAKGGDGGNGNKGNAGGGGMGAGGALFVRGSLDGHDAANLTLANVVFSNNAVQGGNGGNDPESGSSAANSGGGGGLAGNGGSTSGFFGGAGGGGAFPGQDGSFGVGTAGAGPNGGAGGTPGGAGGDFSGGGGAIDTSSGGAGGFGGGGGGGYSAGDGGFGGGGGGASFGGPGGTGGFGGGGGSSGSSKGSGGFGGGTGGVGSVDAGGGGAAMGGAVFVMDGANLTIVGTSGLDGGSVTRGSAGSGGGGTNGQAFGSGLFLQGSGTLSFSSGNFENQTIDDDIADEAGVVAKGYTPPSGFTPGSYNLVKSGVGTLALMGDNAYSGTTTVNAGALLVGGSITSDVTVNAGAMLGGTGTTGDVDVASGGTLAPGFSPGILHTGSVALAGGAHLSIQLAGTTAGPFYDQVAVTGTADVTGATLDLSLIGGFLPAIGAKFTIIANDGSDAVTGTFAGLAEGKKFYVGSDAFTISYHAGSGNDVVLTSVMPGNVIVGSAAGDFIGATTSAPGQPLATNFADIIAGRGGDDTISGLGGNDHINGGGGNDQLFGGGGNDVLLGGVGNDLLVGNAGDDRLDGGGGNDRQIGGPGADHFIFNTLVGVTTIGGFTHGEDKIELAKSVFISAGHVHYDATNGFLLFDADGAGGVAPVHFATLAAHLTVNAGDYLFV